MYNYYILNAAIIVVVTFCISALLMPLMIKIAHHIGAMDVPRDKRRVHKKPIPKLGGLGIFLAFLFAYMLFGVNSTRMNAILLGGIIIVLTGMIDDINPIKARQKLLGQILSALILIFYGNILLQYVDLFGYTLHFGIWAYPITLLFIVACVNMINLIDGLDGLSAGISSIFYLTIGIIAMTQLRFNTLELTITFIMLGASLGFLLFNFNPAKIFAGDAGAMFMGYMIAVISLLGFKGALLTSLGVPLLVLAIPILDTAFAIIRRIIRRQPIHSADKDHLHHQFLKKNFSQRRTVLTIYAINILFSTASILMFVKSRRIGFIIYLVLFLILIWLVKYTSIIVKKDNDSD